MNLEKLTIEGYKSIGKIEFVKPNRFTVFVGPNASGKSNIFEALELLSLCEIMNPNDAKKLFGTSNDIFNQSTTQIEPQKIILDAYLSLDLNHQIHPTLVIADETPTFASYIIHDTVPVPGEPIRENKDYKHFVNFTRLFLGQPSRLQRNDDSRISTYGYKQSNLEKVLKRILKDESKREEIFEILQLLIPGFERVEIVSSELSGRDDLIIYETGQKKPLNKELISDGTFNIISILAALYQSDEPQFLCIEEPENGINPFVVKELVNIIRDLCEEKGHYIWLNTHSQSLVSVLSKEEIIIVDKKNGLTEIKQIQDMDLHGLRMDDALYTNSIGGGNPW